MSSPRTTDAVPVHENPKDLDNFFAKCFSEKINNLRNCLEATELTPPTVQLTETYKPSLSKFSEVSKEDILKPIRSASITACNLDPLPRDLFQLCLSDILPHITKIVNLLLISGMFPDTLKHARIVPFLKKQGLDTDELSNSRPISNLAFLVMVNERMAGTKCRIT